MTPNKTPNIPLNITPPIEAHFLQYSVTQFIKNNITKNIIKGKFKSFLTYIGNTIYDNINPNNDVPNNGILNTSLCPSINPFDVNGNGNILHIGLAKLLWGSLISIFNICIIKHTITKPAKNIKPSIIESFITENIIMKKVSINGDNIVKNSNIFDKLNVIAPNGLENLELVDIFEVTILFSSILLYIL